MTSTSTGLGEGVTAVVCHIALLGRDQARTVIQADQPCPGPRSPSNCPVSPNTVSAHISSIYAKLQVRDRSSAVRRARELRLLAAAVRTR